MNPTVLAMMPGTTNNQLQQSNQVLSNSTAKFGTVLENTILNNQVSTTSDSGQAELSVEQINTIKDLLTFLKMNSITDLHEGKSLVEKLLMDENYRGKDDLLQLLKKFNGEDESVVAEFLASILQVGLSLSQDDQQANVDESQDVNQQLLGALAELKVSIEDLISKKVPDTQDIKQLFSEISPELYTKLTQLNSLDVKDISKMDMNGAANLLKLAKLQDLLGAQDLSQDAALIQKEIKNLLENISEKLEKWLGSQPTKAGNESKFAALLENGTNKSLDVVKQTYARVLNTDGETSNETVSNGLTLKTAESNTQSSGLPFQMTKLEQYVLTASKNGQPVDAEQFVKSFESILSKANFSKANGVQKLLIRLNPENLGSLRIELIQKEGTMVAKILATTAQAKELLDRQLQGLKNAFTNQNIQVEKIEVAQQISTFNAERFASRNHEQNEQQQQHQPQTNEENDNEENDFTNRFTEALLNLEV